MRTALISVVLVSCLVLSGPYQAEAAKALTNQDVVQMVNAGLPESMSLLSIRPSAASYSTSPQDLIALKKAGVKRPVRDALLTPEKGVVRKGDSADYRESPVKARRRVSAARITRQET